MKAQGAFSIEKGDQPLITGYLGGLLTVVLPFGNAMLPRSWFYQYSDFILTLWLFGIGMILLWVDYHAKNKRNSYLQNSKHSTSHNGNSYKSKKLLLKAFARWFAWLLILGLCRSAIHFFHGYGANEFASFREWFDWVILGWAIAGIPYYVITLRRYSGLRWDRRDVAVLVLILLKNFLRLIAPQSSNTWQSQSKRLSILFHNRTSAHAWLGLAIKAFFLPLMVMFYFKNAYETLSSLSIFQLDFTVSNQIPFFLKFNHFYKYLFNQMFLSDVTIVTLGYFFTIRWLDNGIKSTQPSGLGWLVCMLCYKPVTEVSGWYLFWPNTEIDVLQDSWLKVAILSLILFLIWIYLWATLAFGLRFSNLTNRGIVTQGPYRFIRHPAYASKNLAWWLQYAPSFAINQLPLALSMIGWNLIYWLRAWTEERHLSLDPKYQIYKAKVKYRFIPKLY